jgi:hypothetical protein
MKKVLLFVAVVAAASFASCKKDRVCSCTSVDTFTGGGSATSATVTTYTKAKKGDARAACLSSTTTYVGGTNTTTCSIK